MEPGQARQASRGRYVGRQSTGAKREKVAVALRSMRAGRAGPMRPVSHAAQIPPGASGAGAVRGVERRPAEVPGQVLSIQEAESDVRLLCFLNFDSTISLFAIRDNEFVRSSDDPESFPDTFLD